MLMRNIFIYLFLISTICRAQYSGYKPIADLEGFKVSFMTASQKTQSIKSDFVQEKNLSMLSEKIVSKGKFWFKRSNKVRMEYVQPFQYLMIMNDSQVYVKDGQKENKVSTKSNKLFQQINKITLDCMQGSVLSNADFSVKVFENAQNYLIELSPKAKNLAAFFKNINLTVHKKDYEVTKIEMFEPSGDSTSMSFINREQNGAISDAIFSIK